MLTLRISAGETVSTLSASHFCKTPHWKMVGKQVRYWRKWAGLTDSPTDLALKPSAQCLKLKILARAFMSLLAEKDNCLLVYFTQMNLLCSFCCDLLFFWLTSYLLVRMLQKAHQQLREKLSCPLELSGPRQDYNFLGTVLSMSCSRLSCFH